jgi:hypothetical protein
MSSTADLHSSAFKDLLIASKAAADFEPQLQNYPTRILQTIMVFPVKEMLPR